jgi:NADH-quinone oxidoreductase subunit N
LAGFYAKLTVVKAVVDVNLIAVAVIAVLMSVIGAFYYLRMIKVMYFDAPDSPHLLEAGATVKLLFSTNVLAVLALGLFPGALLTLCTQVFM